MSDGAGLVSLLREAKEAWGFDERTLADRADLDDEGLRAVFAGNGDAGDYDAVARALGGTLDDLLAGRRFWEAPTVAFKSAPAGLDVSAVRATLLRVASAARARAALTAVLEGPISRGGGALGLSPEALAEDEVAQAEELAARVRVVLANPLEPIASVRAVMLRLGVATFLTDFGTSAVDGMFWRDEEGRAYAAANVRARKGKLTALRMTLAHELCHALFDGRRLEPLGLVERREERGAALERRANAFAAHFLAPNAAVLRFLAERGLTPGHKPTGQLLVMLSGHFRLGVKAMAGRLLSMRVWTPEDVTKHWHLSTTSARGEDNAELHAPASAAIVPLERRGEVLTLATQALGEGRISVARWRELLGLRASDEWRALLEDLGVGLDVEHRTAL